VTGAYYLAAVAGAVLFFSPGGLGVREAILIAALPAVSGGSCAVAAAVLMRVLTLISEAVLTAVFVVAAARPRRSGA
jgi:hypothetical protein